MNSLVAWALGGIGMAFVSTTVLHWLVRRGAGPSRVLVIWAALASACIMLIALPALGEVVHRCWLVLHNGQPTRFDAVAALVSAAVLIFAVSRAFWRLRRASGARCRLHEHHLELARILDGTEPTAGAVVWLPIPDALAYSVTGDPPLIVASTGCGRVSIGRRSTRCWHTSMPTWCVAIIFWLRWPRLSPPHFRGCH